MPNSLKDGFNVTRAELKELIGEAVTDSFIKIGFKVEDPIELQKDLAHLRFWRTSVEQVQQKSMLAAITVVTTGVLGAFWYGLKAAIAGTGK